MADTIESKLKAVAGSAAIPASFVEAVLPALQELRKTADDSKADELVQATDVVETTMTMFLRGVVATTVCNKPKPEDWGSILDPVMDLSRKAGKDLGSGSPFYNARKAAEEYVMCVSALAQDAPLEAARVVAGGVEFFLAKAGQSSDANEGAWAKHLRKVAQALDKWLSQAWPGKLAWGGSSDAADYFKETPLGPRAQAVEMLNKKPSGGGAGGVFGSLANFSTAKLNKVSDDMKSKNMKDKAPFVPTSAPKAKAVAPAAAPKATARGPKGPPKMELENERTWRISNQDGEKSLSLDNVTMSQSVYISNCRNSTIVVTGKVKNVTIDSCTKVNVVVADVLSCVECVDLERCAFQTTGTVNAIAIDKCNGMAVHLNDKSVGAEITSSKSCEMNVNIPDPDDPSDTLELAIPEQFVTKVVGKKLKTEISDLYR